MYRFKLILEIIQNENLLDNAKNMGKYLLDNIICLSENYPGYITNPRGCGLFCAFDLPSTSERDLLIKKLLKEKLIILGSGDQSIRFRPHLNVSKEELDLAITSIDKATKGILN